MSLFGGAGAGLHIPGTNTNLTFNPLFGSINNATGIPNLTPFNTSSASSASPSAPTAAPAAPAATTTNTGASTTSGRGSGGGTTSSKVALDQAAIDNTNKSLAQLPAILSAALAANDQQLANSNQSLDAQRTQQQDLYDKNTATNQQNYDSNVMAALRAGAAGLRGLLSILRGTGAEDWANNAVRDTTNSDIQTGLTTHDTNQNSLETALANTLNDISSKRQQNEAAHTSGEFAARLSNATQLQDLYQKLAGYYADAGDTANATKYLNQAGDQSGDVARYGTVPVAAYNTAPAVVSAPTISAFGAPSDLPISYSPGNTGNSNGIFTIGNVRKQLAGAGA